MPDKEKRGVWEAIVETVYNAYWRYFPYSLERFVARQIKGNPYICDLGCGDGKFVQHLKELKKDDSFSVVGCDIYSPYLCSAKDKKVYRHLVRCDLRKLPFKHKVFDTLLFINVIEHLEKEKEYLDEIEKLATGKIIITTSKGYSNNPENGVIYQRHISAYDIEDFVKRGYTVRGQGSGLILGSWYKSGKVPLLLRPFISLSGLILTAFTYYHPNFADALVCVKELNSGVDG